MGHVPEQLQLALLGAMERLRPGGRCIIITYKRKDAVQVKRFIRDHEDVDPRFAVFMTPQRLGELYPLLTTHHPWSCRLVCEPLKSSMAECEKNPKAWGAVMHILCKESRDPSRSPCLGMRPRRDAEQFKRPQPLQFRGSV